jgi:hypothetical protein
MASSVKGGMHIAVFPNVERAEKFASDLYNFFSDTEVYLFPSSNDAGSKNSIQDSSRKVQRTAAIRAIDRFEDENGQSDKNVLILVAYADSVSEPVLKKKKC